MNRHRTPILTAIAAIVALGALAGAALVVVPARATEPSGVTTTMIGVGRFGEIDAKAKTDINPGAGTDFWKARIKIKGSSISMSWSTRSRPAGRSDGTAIPARAW